MKQYIDLVKRCLNQGRFVETRNGNCHTVYGAQLRFDLRHGFPMVTTKKVNFHNIAGELCWFLSGDTDTSKLKEWGINIWDANAGPDGSVGRAYGAQWRAWEGELDQIARAINLLRKAPNSRRNVVTAWNPAELDAMALPPCHFAFQVHYYGDGEMGMQASMRSTDVMVGLPYNIASYALLAHLIAKVVGMTPVELIMDLGNVHLYEDHAANARIQVARKPLPLPSLVIAGSVPESLKGLHPSQFWLDGYQHHGFLKYEMHA